MRSILRQYYLLAILGSISTLSYSQQVILESSLGQSYVMEIAPENSFKDVIDSISQGLLIAESQALDTAGESLETIPELNHIEGFKIYVASNNALIAKAVSKSHPQRHYHTPPTASEKADIAYIVNTLANMSLLKIKGEESSLKRAGDRIHGVHPLQFLTHVFTNEELKVSMRNLKGRSWVWKEFLSGITDTLKYEHSQGAILPHSKHFANKIEVDINLILPHIQNGKWDKFIETLIDKVPRKGNSGRYGM